MNIKQISLLSLFALICIGLGFVIYYCCIQIPIVIATIIPGTIYVILLFIAISAIIDKNKKETI